MEAEVNNPIKISQAKTLLIDVLKAGLVPNLKGSPGLGKSDIIREIAKEFNLKVIDFRLAQADPTDLNGFPTLNEDRTRSHYAPPMNLPLKGDKIPDGFKGWLLFFDEMNAAPMSVQAASYKVILDRAVGDEELHDDVAMVCAGNLDTDRAITNRLSTAMQSRLIHLNLVVDSKEWLHWAAKNKIDSRIISFIGWRPDLLHKFVADHNGDTFPCPRTWHFKSKLIKDKATIPFSLLPLLAGTVGEGPANEFMGFIEIYENLPTFAQILANPKGIIIPDDAGIKYALTALISNKADTTNIDILMQLVERLPIEFQVITLQNIIGKDKAMLKNSNVKIWISANASELIED